MQSAISTSPNYIPAGQPSQSPMPFPVVPPSYQWMPMPPQPTAWTLKEKVVVGLVGLAVVGGTAFFIHRQITKAKSNKEENKSFEDGGAATYAKQVKMAFENDGWFGTDTNALRNVLRQIPSQEEFYDVTQSYENMYSTPTEKANMLRDMKDELQSTEYNEMLQIINGKPAKKGGSVPSTSYDAWAKRLKAAFDKSYGPFGGTDGDAIVAVFTEIPTQNDFVKVAIAYQKDFGTSLGDDLKSEGEFGQYEEWMKIIITKRKQ